ncbi:MAG: hypothetical protein R3321_06870, partial [Nitrososphaeraceae archaeon]|nr:hypothetical protein [Nitrososphaeraceae archaeon]
GYCIKLSDFYSQFMKSIDTAESVNWNTRKVGKAIQLPFVKGRSVQNNQVYIGNMDWDKPSEERSPFIVLDGKLVAKRG